MVQATGDVLAPQHFPPDLHSRLSVQCTLAGAAQRLSGLAALVRQLLDSGQTDIYHDVHAAFDRTVLDEVLRHTHGSQASAAQLLGISRTTLRAKLTALGLETTKGSEEDESQ